MRRTRTLTIAICAAAALAAAGCGSSSKNSSSSSASTAAAAPEPTSTVVATPTTGPLSKRPVVQVPKGPPPTKLVVKDLVVGKGRKAVTGDPVVVNYVGVLYSNGKEFDASWDRNTTFPFSIGLGQVIRGWDEGVPGMRVGGRRELIIPPSLGYGATGQPPKIPKNATLVFVIDLVADNTAS